MEGTAADHVAVDDDRGVNEDAAADFEVELALGHGGHVQALHDAGAGNNLDAMANAHHRLLVFPEPAGRREEGFIFTKILGAAATTEEDAGVFLGLDVLESDIAVDRVTFPFLGNRPTWLHLMEHGLINALIDGSEDRLEAGFLQAVDRIHRIQQLGGVADDHEHLRLVGVLGLVGARRDRGLVVVVDESGGSQSAKSEQADGEEAEFHRVAGIVHKETHPSIH